MKTLVFISLLISIFGISILYILTKTTAISEVSIDKIDTTYLGKTITTSGKIIAVYYRKGHIFLTLYDKRYINVAIFSNVAKFLTEEPKKGQRIIVTGVVEEYQGRLQIVPKKAEDIKMVK